MTLKWDSGAYEEFSAFRRLPTHELIGAVRINAGRFSTAFDWGCGPGQSTATVHQALDLDTTIGLDVDENMLTAARRLKLPGMRFENRDIREPLDHVDMVFSNALLQWLPDHEALVEHAFQILAPGGVFAFSVPNNADHFTHRLAADLAKTDYSAQFSSEEAQPFRHTLSVRGYSEAMTKAGFRNIDVWERCFVHSLSDSKAVLRWLNGTTLRYYRSAMSDSEWQEFGEQYEQRLNSVVGLAPVRLHWNRIFVVGIRPR